MDWFRGITPEHLERWPQFRELSTRARNCIFHDLSKVLASGPVEPVMAKVAGMTAAQIKGTPNCGYVTAREIGQWLAKYGYESNWFIHDQVKNKGRVDAALRSGRRFGLLEGLGMVRIESKTNVDGPGNVVFVYWTAGDCRVACINFEGTEVLWDAPAGGTQKEVHVVDITATSKQYAKLVEDWANRHSEVYGE